MPHGPIILETATDSTGRKCEYWSTVNPPTCQLCGKACEGGVNISMGRASFVYSCIDCGEFEESVELPKWDSSETS